MKFLIITYASIMSSIGIFFLLSALGASTTGIMLACAATGLILGTSKV